MAIIYSYPQVVPTVNDMVLGVRFIEDEGTSTNSFYISDLVTLVSDTIGDITQGPPGPPGPPGQNGTNGETNLTTTQTVSNFTINSDTGTDAIVPLGNGTLAGATLNNYTTAEKNKLDGIQVGTWGVLNYPAWTTGTPFVKMTATGTFSLDTTIYLSSITSSDVTTALGYTPVTNARTLTINGTSYDLSADRSWTIPTGSGGVTSVSGTGTVSGLTLTGTVTSSGDLTLGGTLVLTSANITDGLGYTPSSFAEPGIFSGGGTPTLASGVTAAEIRTLIDAGTPIDDADFVKNTSDTYIPSAKITQMVTLSQAQYDAIASPLTSTIYIIL